MSSPRSHFPPAPVRERAMCMCATGAACTSFAPGHALHLIQARLSSATPTGWSDALVETADTTTGVVGVRLLDGSLVMLWSGAGAASAVSPGLPVALHDRYDVLSVGRALFNCLRG